MRRLFWTALMLLAVPVMAQESASFRLTESVLNSGGSPASGVTPTSASFRIGIDALGSAVGGGQLSSSAFQLDVGFTSAYRPPLEVSGLIFDDADTLVWLVEKAAVDYTLYRGLMSAIAGLGYGSCEATDITTTTVDDPDIPPVADAYFYLVTSNNRLNEEGTKGFDSNGVERPNPSPCP